MKYPNHRWNEKGVYKSEDKICVTCKKIIEKGEKADRLEVRYSMFRGDDDVYYLHCSCACDLEKIGWEDDVFKRR